LQNNQKNNKNKIFKKNNEGALLLSEQPGHPLYLFCRRKKGCCSCPLRKANSMIKKGKQSHSPFTIQGGGGKLAHWHIAQLAHCSIGTLKKGAILRAAKAGPFALHGSLLLSHCKCSNRGSAQSKQITSTA
jgi:hypothetical protein